MLLEGLAERHGTVVADCSLYVVRPDGLLDLALLAARIADEPDAGFGASLFHATLVEALAEWVVRAARESGSPRWRGRRLLPERDSRARLRAAFARRGLTVLEAHDAPANDGGIALGQAWVAIEDADGQRTGNQGD